MRFLFPTLLAITLLLASTAVQSQIAIGEWRDHLPYTRALSVADAGDIVFCATDLSLFYFDKNDMSINRQSKVNGLSDIGISAIDYNADYNALLIAYKNTNLDLLKDGEIINISDIKRKQILGNKVINNIHFSDSLAYLACGFGIIVLDIKNEEFPEPTYYIGDNGSHVNVLDVSTGNDTLYAATEEGIYKASLQSSNLADFNAWQIDQSLYPTARYNAINFYNDRLFVNFDSDEYTGDTIFMYNYANHNWSRFPMVNTNRKYQITNSYDQMVITGQAIVYYINSDFEIASAIFKINEKNLNARNAIIDDAGVKWIADFSLGLVKTADNVSGDFINPNGPYAANIFDMDVANEELWVASGGHSSTWSKVYLKDGVYQFSNESWKSYNSSTGLSAFDSISDMICITVDPNLKNHAYVGTWIQGVMELLDGEVVNIFNNENSSLQKWPSANYVAVSGIDIDSKQNLWVVNSGAANPLSVKRPNGDWTSFSLGSALSGSFLGDLLIDSYNQKWITLRADNQLAVFFDNNTLDDPSDDVSKILTNAPGNGALPGNKIYCVAQDRDDEIWLGSDEGVGVIYSPFNLFTGGNFDAQRILVEVGGYTQYLLESEIVTTIAIDGNNRKWMGTDRAGVFLLSEDGTEQIHHFTEENSPLYSNRILAIEINNQTGEVFFGTDKGIISYKDTATEPKPTNDDVVVYPNPVREGYAGLIAIKGLVDNADIKITDVAGTLIYATRAEGGQAIWSGYNFDGRRASTGVYLVFATDDQGNEKMVTKILFIN